MDNISAPQKPGDLLEYINTQLTDRQGEKNDKTDHQVWEEIKKYTQQLRYDTGSYEEQLLHDFITHQIHIDNNNSTTNIATNARNEYVKTCLIGTGLIATSAIACTATTLCVPNMIATLGTSCAEPVACSSLVCSAGLGLQGTGWLTKHASHIKNNNVDFQKEISSLTTQLENKKKTNKQWNIDQTDTFLKKCRTLQNNLSYLAQNITLSPGSAIEVLSYMIQIQDLIKQVKEQKKLPQPAIEANYNKSIKENNNYTSSNNLHQDNIDQNIQNNQ